MRWKNRMTESGTRNIIQLKAQVKARLSVCTKAKSKCGFTLVMLDQFSFFGGGGAVKGGAGLT